MYRDQTRRRNWLGTPEPAWQAVAIESNEPRVQIGESDVVYVKNVVARRPGLNQREGTPGMRGQTITSDLARDGCKYVKPITTKRNDPGFLKAK